MSAFPPALQDARYHLQRRCPYFASILWALQGPLERTAEQGMPTMAVDRHWRLYYNAEFIATCSREELEAVLVHEVGHLVHDHPCRMEVLIGKHCPMSKQAFFANLAADLAQNPGIRDQKFTLPKGAIFPDMMDLPEGLLAEEYYDRIVQKDEEQNGKEGDGDGDGKGQSVCGCGQEKKGKGKGKGKGQGAGMKDHGDAFGHGNCGSGAHGQEMPWEEPAPGEGKEGTPTIGEAEAELLRRRVAEAVVEHAQSSQNRGTVPADLLRWAKEKLAPQVRWQDQIAASVRHAVNLVSGLTNYTYSRPSRRQSSFPSVIMPALRHPVPSINVYVDSSGSMSERMLAQALAEIGGILKALGHKDGVSVIVVDAAIQSAKKVFKPEQVNLLGGGGTDQRLAYIHADKARPRPQVMILISDGYSPFPEEAPANMKCILVRTSPGGSAPPFGKIIDIPCD